MFDLPFMEQGFHCHSFSNLENTLFKRFFVFLPVSKYRFRLQQMVLQGGFCVQLRDDILVAEHRVVACGGH